jgi:dolichyl-phosphate-mannose-protein mannosyltransferase
MTRTKTKFKQTVNGAKQDAIQKGQVYWFRRLIMTISPEYAIYIVTALSFATRLYYIHEPDHVCWDETHFGKMASWYLNRTFFFDVHPPLGKMLIALSGYMTGYDGRFAFDKPGDKYEHWTQYLGMRIFCAILGLLIPTMIYRATLSMTRSKQSAFISGLLVVFDNGMITLTRYILLDPPLLFFIAASILGLAEFSFKMGPKSGSSQAFSPQWWFWLIWTGVAIACAFSIKFVGLFIVAHIGFRTIYDIWLLLGDVDKPIGYFIKHFTARAICFILLPICLYVTFFWFHLNQLNHSGNGDGFYSSAFQSQLIGNSLHNSSSPAHLAYGAEITIKNNRIGGAYLHSHWHLYPEGVGAKQQQVTTYSHKDSNNKWFIKRAITDQNAEIFVRDGDLVVLEHKVTRRNLHSHFEMAPLTKRHYQVTCYGENGIGDANDIWKIQKEQSGISSDDDRIYTVKSRFRLIHYLTNCALHSHSKQLPKWGYEQMEVTCNPKLFDRNNFWNIEDNYYPALPNVSFQEYAPSFLAKFVESHSVMLQGNSGLKPKEGEVTSRPWQWPLNYRGQFFSATKGHKIYLLGNPLIWWANLAALPTSLLTLIVLIVMQKIARAKNNNDNKKADSRMRDFGKVADIEHSYLEASLWTLFGWALHYIPFYFMGRVLYFHHYFPAFLFSCMLTAMTADYLMTVIFRKLKTFMDIDLNAVKVDILIVAMSFVVYTFAKFGPLTYGTKIESPADEVKDGSNSTTEKWFSEQQLSSLKWLDSWEF